MPTQHIGIYIAISLYTVEWGGEVIPPVELWVQSIPSVTLDHRVLFCFFVHLALSRCNPPGQAACTVFSDVRAHRILSCPVMGEQQSMPRTASRRERSVGNRCLVDSVCTMPGCHADLFGKIGSDNRVGSMNHWIPPRRGIDEKRVVHRLDNMPIGSNMDARFVFLPTANCKEGHGATGDAKCLSKTLNTL